MINPNPNITARVNAIDSLPDRVIGPTLNESPAAGIAGGVAGSGLLWEGKTGEAPAAGALAGSPAGRTETDPPRQAAV